MKKIYILIIFTIFSFAGFTSTACNNGENNYEENSIDEIQDSRAKVSFDINNTAKKDYLEPCYGDYEEIDDGIVLYSSDAKKDEFESNNSFTAATKLSPTYSGSSAPTDYSRTINATIHRNEWLWGLIKREVDEDYYVFNTYGKASITLKLTNVPQNCDYDMEFYKHDNIKYAEEDSISLIQRSTYAGNHDETIHFDCLYAGVYYIRISSYKDTYDAQNPYQLYLNVDYQSEDVAISDLKFNKGIGAALWSSDFDPFGITAFSTSGKSEVGYFTSSTYYSAYKIGHPYFGYIRDDSGINHASLYIWDKSIRMVLYEIVKQSITGLRSELANEESIKAQYNITSKIVNGVALVTDVVLMFVPVANAAASVKVIITSISTITTVGPSFLDCILETLMPQERIDKKKDYLNYLEVLAAALECDQNTSDNEVLKIDSNYKIVSESVPMIVQMNYDIDYTPTIQDHYLYSDNIIHAFQSEAKFNGTVYPLKTLEDINNARNKSQSAFSDINTGGDTEIFLDESYPNTIDVGEYHWYHFIAPEDGIYTFCTNSNMDTYGELFSNIVPGNSTSGRLDMNDDSGNNFNFSISYPIHKNRTIYLRVHGYNWKSTGIYSLTVKKTDELESVVESIKDSDFGFTNEYVDNLNRTNVTLESGFSFTTQRLRCGFINNQYLTLSAKCKNAGLAYLQMDFNEDIYSFSFDIAIWSNEEYLNTKSSIVIERKNKEGKWVTYQILDISSMSKNKDILDNYTCDFSEETYGIRIKVSTNQVNYEKNKGRVVISNLLVKH